MWILPLIGYLGIMLGFAFLTLAIASGLYYLSELVEEHTVLAKKVLTRLIYTIITLLTLLYLIDSLPLTLCLLSILSHLIYAANLRRFPLVRLSDPLFIASCILVLLNHYFWFGHFSAPSSPHYGRSSSMYGAYDSPADVPSFREISAFFGLLVWLVPFALFVSLSASDNVLPTMAAGPSGDSAAGLGAAGGVEVKKGHRRRNTGLAKQIVGGAVGWIKETGEAGGLWEGEGRGVGRRF